MLELSEAYAPVKNGWVRGERLASGVKAFRGIPFAAPPLGRLRWRPPEPAAEWLGIRQAVHFGPKAVQADDVAGADPPPEAIERGAIPAVPRSEDCLYLNVWTPAESSRERLPVFLWIHGGSLVCGAGAHFLNDGAALAERNIVVVTINYRLGVFGFLAHPELSAESEQRVSGNYGLLDQLAAIRWVRENIAGFGGDPERLTVGGQSAGALAVGALIASPLARGLFQRATLQSGPPFGLGDCYVRLAAAEADGRRFMAAAGAANLAELRAIPAWELFARSRSHSFQTRIVIDGWLLPDAPGELIRAGGQNPVALLLGGTSDEFSDGYSADHGLAARDYRRHLQSRFGPAAARLLELYPAGEPYATARSAIRLGADRLLAAARLVARLVNDQGSAAYLYYFSRALAAANRAFYGANHSAELPFVFGIVDKGALFPWDDRPWDGFDHRYSAAMMSYWTNFVKNGDPNDAALPRWPRYCPAEDGLMEFGAAIAPTAAPRPEGLAFLESLF